jgi:hypothetical protein
MSPKNFNEGVWFTAGLGLIGAATGYFVALSRSPVVAVVLPLVFGLIGGAGGVYLAKADVKSDEGRYRLALIGNAVGALALVMVLTTAVTLWSRNAATYQALSGVAGVSQLDAKDQLTLVGLRAQLELLGASADEQKSVLTNAAKVDIQQPDTPADLARKLRAISAAGKGVIAAFDSPISPDVQKLDIFKKMTGLKLLLGVISPTLQQWADALDAKTAVSADEINVALEMLNGAVRAAVGKASDTAQAISDLAVLPKLAESLISLRIKLDANQPNLYGISHSALNDINDVNVPDLKNIIAEPAPKYVPGSVPTIAERIDGSFR